ncbi:hypothetical protein FR047_20650 [Salmonella enterica]|nr:hypothetical protein [Salmonella enterica]
MNSVIITFSGFKSGTCQRYSGRVSNFKPWFKKGRVIGFIMTGIEHWLLPRMGIKKSPGV